MAYLYRGQVEMQAGKYDEAERDFTKAMELEPENEISYNNRAMTYFYLNRKEDGLRDLDKALELNPNNPVTYYNRGFMLLNMDRTEEACEAWNKVQELGDAMANNFIGAYCNP